MFKFVRKEKCHKLFVVWKVTGKQKIELFEKEKNHKLYANITMVNLWRRRCLAGIHWSHSHREEHFYRNSRNIPFYVHCLAIKSLTVWINFALNIQCTWMNFKTNYRNNHILQSTEFSITRKSVIILGCHKMKQSQHPIFH